MKQRFGFLSLAILFSCLMALSSCSKDYFAIMAVTGATPLALAEKVPEDINLKVDGLTKRDYEFSGLALRALATTRIRTREVAPDGEFLGCYIYNGIPLYNILEGIAPKEDKTAVFDKPLDLVVTFISASGEKAHFGYGELTMADDTVPVTLAFHRKELLPHKNPEKYTKNKFKGNITGLKLICPAEPDTARYLDNVTRITLTRVKTPDTLLPGLQKGKKCSSDTLKCVPGDAAVDAVFAGVMNDRTDRWVRVGHGQGYKGIGKAEGYRLDSFLKKNFPDLSDRDFFIFVAGPH